MVFFQSNGGSFQVHSSKQIAIAFEKLYKQAKREGRAEAFMAAARELGVRLQHSPGDLGEPLYQLPAMQLEIRHAALGPLLVYFGVHKDRPLVFIKHVALLPEKVS